MPSSCQQHSTDRFVEIQNKGHEWLTTTAQQERNTTTHSRLKELWQRAENDDNNDNNDNSNNNNNDNNNNDNNNNNNNDNNNNNNNNNNDTRGDVQ